jgi:hypothetical protein
MANTTTTTKQVTSWTDFYESKRDEIASLTAVYVESFESLAEMTLGIKTGADLAITIASRTYNFLILTGEENSINLLHHCYNTTKPGSAAGVVIGIHGTRRTAPFKAFDPAQAVSTLRPPRPQKKDKKTKRFIPSLQMFLTTKTKKEFEDLRGTEQDNTVDDLATWPNCFLAHPNLFRQLNSQRQVEASVAGMALVNAINDADGKPLTDDEEDSDEENEEEHSTEQRTGDKNRKSIGPPCYNLIVYLWSVANGFGATVQLIDPPDSDLVDARNQSVANDLQPASNNTQTPPAGPVPMQLTPVAGTDPELIPALVKNLQAMTENQLKETEREAKKRSMTSRLSIEAADMFTLLSAKDWKDKKPKMNLFTEKLTEDKDAMKALNLIASCTREWKGVVSEKGLTQFFTTGYAALDVSIQPGGFTIFMFKPRIAGIQATSSVTLQQGIRSLFGDTKINEDTVRYFAKHEYYLSDSLESLEIQLETCVKFLDLLTAKGGIASAGYTEALYLIKSNRSAFYTLFAHDPLLGVKIAYLLDRIFQEFIRVLCHHRSQAEELGKSTIKLAKRELKQEQKLNVREALGPVKFGIMPVIQLPACLVTAPSRPKEAGRPAAKSREAPDAGSPMADKLRGGTANKPDVNEDVKDEWRLPKEKTYRDFFHPIKCRENTRGWPTVAHHDRSKGPRWAEMCMRYQTTGKCSVGCGYAHIAPNKLPANVANEITTRLQKMFLL